MLQQFVTRCRLGWPARGRLATHPPDRSAHELGTWIEWRVAASFGDVRALAAIDLGSGPVATPIARGLFAMPWRRLISVEMFPPYLEALRSKRSGAAAHEIRAVEIGRAVESLTPGEVDVALMIDVLEHFDKRDALRLLALLERRVRRGIVLFSPVGEVPQEALDGNELQRHRSTWLCEDWLDLGYDVDFYPGFHWDLDPPAAAAWAIKRVG